MLIYECVTEKGKVSVELYSYLKAEGIGYMKRKYTNRGAIMWKIYSTEKQA